MELPEAHPRSPELAQGKVVARGKASALRKPVSRAPDGTPASSVGQVAEIDERRLGELAEHERDDVFHQFAANISDVFWIRSPDMKKVQYLSPAFERIWGRTVDSLLADPSLWSSFILPADRERVVAEFAALTGDKRELDIEYRIVRPDESIRWVHVRGFQIRDAGDHLIRHAGIVTDITGRKQAELSLLESRRFLRSTLDALSAHIAILDGHGVIIEVNQAWNQFARGNNSCGHDGLGQNYLKVCDSAAGKCSEEAIAMARGIRGLIGGQAKEFHLEYPCHSPQAQRWFIVRATRFGGDDGPVRVVVAHEDITERRLAEASLRESAEKLRLIIEHSSQVFYSHNVDGQLTYVSPQATKLFDWAPAEELQLWTAMVTDNPINGEGIESTRRAIETGELQYPYQLELKSKRGRKIWVEVHESPVVVQGKTVAIVGALTDISVRVEAEARRRMEQARHLKQRNALIEFTAGSKEGEELTSTVRRLTETDARTLGVARVSVWRYNADRTAIQCEDLYELVAGRHSSGVELLATGYPAYFRALEGLKVIAVTDARRDAQTCEFAESYLRPLGITSMLDAPIHLRGIGAGVLCHEHVGLPRHWKADEETFAIAMANQASLAMEGAERQRTETQLRQSEERYRSLIDNARDAIFTLAVDGTFTSLNPAFETILGVARADWLGQSFAAMIRPDDLPLAVRMFQGVVRGEVVPVFELRGHPELTRPVLMELTLTAQKGEGGDIIGALGIGRDITERKRSEAELEKAHRELMVASRQAGMAEVATDVLHNVGNVLNSVNVSATLISDQVRQTEAGNVAKLAALFAQHQADLSGFLTTDPRGRLIPGYLGTLAGSLAVEQQGMLAELAQLRKNIDHIKEIVSMQQTYARAFGLIETVAVAELIEDALRMNAESLVIHGIEVVRDYRGGPAVATDKHRVVQILVNLVRNARQACAGSGREDKRITVRTTGDAHHLRIAVADNGDGIPAENLARIFNHGFTTRKDGHGFGLHSSALAAKELGGSLSVQSDGPGQGATFTLELPLPDAGGPG